MNEELPKCKCGAYFLIDSEHVSFNTGKVAYIRCSECKNKQRIGWALVKHLKEDAPEEEATGLINEVEEAINSLQDEDEDLLKALESEQREKEAAALNQDQEEGNGAGWALAAVTGLAGLFLIAAGLKRA